MAIPLLFLFADTGGGHRASAMAVKRDLDSRFPGAYEIAVVDPFAEASPKTIKRGADLYGPIIQNAHWLWAGLYHSTNSRAIVAAMRGSILRPVRKGLQRLIAEMKPAAVISFHPLLNHIGIRAVRGAGRSQTPFITVVTDLVDIHAAWACREADAVVVPSPGGVDRCRRAGVPAGRVHHVGLPVDQTFSQPPPSVGETRELRERLGLHPDRFTVLLCGGADGSGSIAKRAKALAASSLNIELAVICGRNRRAQTQLAGLKNSRGETVTVEGFVTNMADWIRAADLVITKAGPGTIAETLCCGKPLVLCWYLPGQERGNVEWVVDTGAGRYVPSTGALVDTVAELSAPGSHAMVTMREAVKVAARPEATAKIADLIRSFAPSSAR